jgi:DNA repair exonuclease SbcCD nuclease subunit
MLIVGDLHLGLSWDSLDRTSDVFEALEEVKKYVTAGEHIIFLGDVFESSAISHSVVAHFLTYLSDIKKKSCVDIYILCGNHDGNSSHRKGSPLEEIEASGLAKVIWEPQLITGIGYMLPYTFTEIKESDVPQGVDTYSHVDIPGAVPGFEAKIGRGLPVALPAWMSARASRIFGGHIHRPQKFGNITIVGSLISTDLSEVGDCKRVIITKPNTLEFESIPLVNRPLMGVEVVYGTPEYTKNLDALLATLQITTNGIVSVNITCPHTKAHEVDWLKLESEIRARCYYLRWSLNVVKEREVRVKDLDLQKTDGEIITDFVNKQNITDKVEVLKCCEEIII